MLRNQIRESQLRLIRWFLRFGIIFSGILFAFYLFTFLLFDGLDNTSIRTTTPMAFIFCIVFSAELYLLNRGYYSFVSTTVVWGIFSLTLISIQILNLGFFSPLFYLIFVLIAYSGYLLGLRQLALLTASAIIAITFFYLEAKLGFKVTSFPIPRVDLLIVVIISLILTAYATNTTIVELANRTDELEQYQDQLEELVFDRTSKLGAALDAAKHANQAKSIFLATMSHELRTPLNAIIGYTELIEEDLLEGEVKPETVIDADRVKKSSKHLLNLINSILDLSKIEAGEEQVLLEAVSILEIVEEAINTSLPLFEKNKNQHSLQVMMDAHHMVLADRSKLLQILLNLISNANKFTQEGEITVVVSDQQKSETILFTIEDTGIGIPEDQIEHLFEPFSQLENDYNRKYEGTGLGLAISKRFCEMMNMEIYCKNRPCGGAAFYLEMRRECEAKVDDSINTQIN